MLLTPDCPISRWRDTAYWYAGWPVQLIHIHIHRLMSEHDLFMSYVNHTSGTLDIDTSEASSGLTLLNGEQGVQCHLSVCAGISWHEHGANLDTA